MHDGTTTDAQIMTEKYLLIEDVVKLATFSRNFTCKFKSHRPQADFIAR